MEKNLPKISVITVCLNAVNVIDATISSVLSQTYKEIEYIIIDGGSVDGTVELLYSYQQQNILRYISEPDSGIYDAMNKGIKNALGDLIIFLNAGDSYLTPYVLEEVVSKINIQDSDIFFGRILWVDIINNSTVLSDHYLNKYEWDLKHSNFPHPATIYKKKLFTEIGLFDETFKILADYEWNVRALVKFSIPFQYLNIAIARFTADGISNDPRNADTILQETKEIYQRYFRPAWLFSFVEKSTYNHQFSGFKKMVLAKLYHKNLNRVYW